MAKPEESEGLGFLRRLERAADEAGSKTDELAENFGEKLPATIEHLGLVLKQVYYCACCAWGCAGGDHQIEWLAGRVANQAMGAYRLIRAGLYDEALVLVRGVGEIANLFWLFEDGGELDTWKTVPEKDRRKRFQPKAVRDRLKSRGGIGSPIDDDRYRRLCEVGTHPVPQLAPGHFTGTGTPILGHIVQPAGVGMAATELGYALAMSALPLAGLLALDAERASELRRTALDLVRSLGSITVLNYEEVLGKTATSPGLH